MKIFRHLLLASVCCALSLAAAAQSRPELFERPSHDFGTFARGESRRTEFTLVNTTDAPLVVTGVRATCRCLRFEWPRRPLAPGESGRVGVVFRSREGGSFYRQISVGTSASAEPYTLFVKGVVE